MSDIATDRSLTNAERLIVFASYHSDKLGQALTDELLEFAAEWQDEVEASSQGGGAGRSERAVETLETIAAWCEETFGPIEPARIAERAAEEMDELRAEPTRVEEAADVVIVLSRYPGLWAEVQRKMAVNRQRKWRLMGDGTGYHVKPAPAQSPSTSDREG